MDYLRALNIPKEGIIKLPITELGKVVGGLSGQTNRRISYWDPIMGQKTLNPGAAAWKAGFVVVQFDYEPDRDMPRLVAITFRRYK
jgi:hypothetical protein